MRTLSLPRPDPNGVALLFGGVLVGFGAILPWLELFAGLHTFRGVAGLHGRVLLGAGVVLAVAGVWRSIRPDRWIGWGALTIAVGTAIFLATRLTAMQAFLQEHKGGMMVVEAGPGLGVAAAGVLLAVVAAAAALISQNVKAPAHHH